MENSVIGNESLTSQEVHLILEATKQYPNLIYVGPKTWSLFDHIYKIYEGNSFAGVCAVNTFGRYAKIGPFVLLPPMQGKGLGKKLLQKIVNDYKDTYTLYVASSNAVVWHIAGNAGFVEYKSFLQIPLQIWIIYHKMSWKVFCAGEVPSFIQELIRKSKMIKRENVKHLYLPSNQKSFHNS